MKLEKDGKWGFYICPKCGLPLVYREEPDSYVCNTTWGCGIKGCGFAIIWYEVENDK